MKGQIKNEKKNLSKRKIACSNVIIKKKSSKGKYSIGKTLMELFIID